MEKTQSAVRQEDREAAREMYLVEHMVSDEANAFSWGWRDNHHFTQIAVRHRLAERERCWRIADSLFYPDETKISARIRDAIRKDQDA